MNPRGLLLVGGFAAAIATLLLGSRPARAAAASPADDRAWVRRVIAFVSASEGRADSVNRNLDGAGLSFGILQWNQRSGALGVLLRTLYQDDPASFARIFGPSWAELLEATGRAGLDAVAGTTLWNEPWVPRFVAAGRWPPFVEVQWRLAESGDHFQGALDVARILGVRTERAMALFFDRAVQQGPNAARQMAEQLRANGVPGYPEVLYAFADFAASRFRRSAPPETPYYSTRARHIVRNRTECMRSSTRCYIGGGADPRRERLVGTCAVGGDAPRLTPYLLLFLGPFPMRPPVFSGVHAERAHPRLGSAP